VDETVRYHLRSTRVAPPGKAGQSDGSSEMYNAALQQFEEYMTAAASVGPATRPVHLYYAIAQAGAAILTAHDTEAPNAHGLTVGTLDVGTPLHRLAIRPKGRGMFQAVAAATHSPIITMPVELGAAWASLPELVDAIGDDVWPLALRIREIPESSDVIVLRRTSLETTVRFTRVPQSREQLDETLGRYPTATGYIIPQPLGVPGVVTMRTVGSLFGEVPVSWAAATFGEQRDIFRRVAPSYRDYDDRWLRPGLGTGLELPSELMTWWLVLYALSMISRYRPRDWAQSLEIGRSEIAADIEFCLNAALEAVPRLVLNALTDI
jgi:hypothetical protein